MASKNLSILASGPEKGSQPAKIAGPAESSGPPTGTGSSAVTISRTSTGFTKQKGGKKKKKKALAAAAEQGGTDVEGGGSASALSGESDAGSLRSEARELTYWQKSPFLGSLV